MYTLLNSISKYIKPISYNYKIPILHYNIKDFPKNTFQTENCPILACLEADFANEMLSE